MLFPGIPSNMLEASNLQQVIYPDFGGQAATVSVPPAPESSSSQNTGAHSQSDNQQKQMQGRDPNKGRYIDVYA